MTATAVRQRLRRLQAEGCVDRRTTSSGRGRPGHHYFVTDHGRRQLGENYEELAVVLWRELKNISNPDVRAAILSRVQDVLVQKYGAEVDGRTILGRLRQLRTALGRCGFDVEVDDSGEVPVLRENNCPYHDLASDDRSICELEQRVFEKVLGSNMILKHRCLDGHHCCEFAPVESELVALGSGAITTERKESEG
ncbi:helix-turn-helix transcriptional regulator [Stratiformator vulcanicus]|uniref:Uncharacterized protein n=1 Tax=Stratiformator vulcanicus TaxID=2527980 RepID=A0A517R341_9PLAN|nr:transcriptional regulator [Stratiformator vulcanicus]QDT38295.1 hypothetical protein Pan189_26860 [Stratiformator vulcanicus]